MVNFHGGHTNTGGFEVYAVVGNLCVGLPTRTHEILEAIMTSDPLIINNNVLRTMLGLRVANFARGRREGL